MIDTKNQKMLPILVVVIVLLGAGIYMSQKGTTASSKGITPAEAKAKAETFVKDVLLGGETTFTISEATEYNAGLYKMNITLDGGGEPIESYITKDGKVFLPQGMDIATMTAEAGGASGDTATAAEQPVTEAPKSDKPLVELFVMSHCPYGTQIEKGILPVVEAMGGNVDFKLKFVDYAMHEKKEIDEQIRQHCIAKEQGGKLLPYLKCFLKAGDTTTCLKEQGIDEKKLTACVTATDKEFKITEAYNDKANWGGSFPPFNIHKADNDKYGVQGSPTLVINGKEISSGRDSASLAKAICGAFNDGKKPKECDNTFASAAPAPGFGEGTTAGATTEAQCN